MQLVHLPRALTLLLEPSCERAVSPVGAYQKVATSSTLAISQYVSWDTAVT